MGGPSHNDVRSLYFPKTGEEIKSKCIEKIANLQRRIQKREETITSMLKEHNLSTLDVMQLMRGNDEGMFSNAMPESASNAPLLAAKEHLKTADWEALSGEDARRNSEIEEVSKLQMIARNIGLKESYKLTYSEIGYFEF